MEYETPAHDLHVAPCANARCEAALPDTTQDDGRVGSSRGSHLKPPVGDESDNVTLQVAVLAAKPMNASGPTSAAAAAQNVFALGDVTVTPAGELTTDAVSESELSGSLAVTEKHVAVP